MFDYLAAVSRGVLKHVCVHTCIILDVVSTHYTSSVAENSVSFCLPSF